jgi:predicted phosphodiesterase
MATKLLTLAVLSDLHCQAPSEGEQKIESHLIAGAPRVPIAFHPIQSLVRLARDHNIRADAIICCGDMANKASQIGLSHVWDLLRVELGPAFSTKTIYCTVGNHDIDSRSVGRSPYYMASHIHPDFPFSSEPDNSQFWFQGFCLQNLNNTADFLIINTAHHHWTESAAQAGTFDIDRINALDEYLSTKNPSPIRVAILHHHPILHSSPMAKIDGVLQSGQQLLDILGKYHFKLVIHGHQHSPNLLRLQSLNSTSYVLCAGSFSAMLGSIGTITRNVFHLVTIEFDDANNSNFTGYVKTWEFNLGLGWNVATAQSTHFPHLLPLGPPPEDDLASSIIYYLKEKDLRKIDVGDLTKEFPSLEYLLPGEIVSLNNQLLQNGFKVQIDQDGRLDSIWRVYGTGK